MSLYTSSEYSSYYTSDSGSDSGSDSEYVSEDSGLDSEEEALIHKFEKYVDIKGSDASSIYSTDSEDSEDSDSEPEDEEKLQKRRKYIKKGRLTNEVYKDYNGLPTPITILESNFFNELQSIPEGKDEVYSYTIFL
jgi:hypothetical protein